MRGVYGMSVLAAVTAQNTLGVQAIHGVPLDIIRAQIDSIAADFQVAAFKIGMLGTAEVIECVAEKLAGKPFGRLVLDPVMVAKGGAPLLQQNAVSALKRHLLPLADVLTPNLPEAEALAKSLVGTGTAMGKKVIAMITNMYEPLGNAVGNFLEMEETYNVLKGTGPEDVTDLTLQLAGWMLVLGHKAASKEEGIQKAQEALRSGKALELFLENITLQGGNAEQFVAECGKRRSPHTCHIKAERLYRGYRCVQNRYCRS